MIEVADLLRSRYELGAREPGRSIDCLGVVIVLAQRMGLCAPDPWPAIRNAWADGRDCTSGFPPCWVRLTDSEPWQDGDVLLFHGRHPGAGIVCRGHVWTANEEVGAAFCRPANRWQRRPAEVWRHDPTAHPQGTPR